MQAAQSGFIVDALRREALALQRSGKAAEAAEKYRNLATVFPRHAAIRLELGVLELQLGNTQAGVDALGAALAIEPNRPGAWLNRGLGLKNLGRYDEALADYDRLIALDSNLAEAYYQRANLLQERGCHDAALADYDRALALKPDYAEAWNNRGISLSESLNVEAALESYRHAVALKPDYFEAYNNLGNALGETKHYPEAVAAYDRAIAAKPDFAAAYYNRGAALKKLKRFDEALASYDRTLALLPEHAEAHNNRSDALRELQRLDEALASNDRALALNPDYVEAYNNRGNILKELKRFDEALESYDRVIALKPEYPDPYWNKALLKLSLGEYREGWRLYEWRHQGPGKDAVRHFDRPLWLGAEPLADRTLLIHAEQGLGDVIQFCRYVHLAAARGAKVVLEAPKPLFKLLTSLQGVDTLVEQGGSLPDFDVHCPIMSLPLAFDTTLDSVPAVIPYLCADPEKQRLWRQKLGDQTRPRIGLVWSGEARHANDHNRSMPWEALAPLLRLPLEFHVLQKEIRAYDEERLTDFPEVRRHGPDLHDFADTAALVAEMDVVISVDTSVAHLAGALGKPVWVLLPFIPDYRWLLDRPDCPWYPTARLFRQASAGDWRGVVEELTERLAAHYG